MKQGKLKILVPLLFLAVIILPHPLKSQTFFEVKVNQPPVLTADAGEDVSIDPGMSTILGGSPAATGGTGSLTSAWKPAYYIADTELENPQATPAGNVTYILTVTDERGCTASDEIIVTVIGGSGVKDNVSENEFIIYPNPNNGIFTLGILNNRTSDIQISILTMTGQVVHNETIPSAGKSSSVSVNISSLPRGSYIMLISSDLNEIYRHIILN
ncbi:MAG: T9SS type A sorting domain-containing protein [Bacteroidales bacterium]|nr:T9SS type A sorting domain-containing protein [Bacteroidales bacterium]